MSPPPPTPAERFAALIAYFSKAVMAHTGWDQRLSLSLIGHIINRLRDIKWRFIRLAVRIQAGRYRRRAFAPRPRIAGPRHLDPLPRGKNWLEPLLPEVVHFRGHLLHLLQDPEIVALIKVAPEALGRPLRSLCRMLGMRPPPILAAKTPRATPATSRVAPATKSPPRPPAPTPFQAAPAPVLVPILTPRKRA